MRAFIENALFLLIFGAGVGLVFGVIAAVASAVYRVLT